MNTNTKPKFERFAEVLPNNATTAKIMKEREEAKAKKDEQERLLKQQQDKEAQ